MAIVDNIVSRSLSVSAKEVVVVWWTVLSLMRKWSKYREYQRLWSRILSVVELLEYVQTLQVDVVDTFVSRNVS